MTYLWALLTTFVPYFKALGAGSYYLQQSFTPLFLLASMAPHDVSGSAQRLLFVLWGISLFFSGAIWEKYCESAAARKANAKPADLRKVLDYLRTAEGRGLLHSLHTA